MGSLSSLLESRSHRSIPSLTYRNNSPLVLSLGAKWQIQKLEGLTKGKPDEVTTVKLALPASFVNETLKAKA